MMSQESMPGGSQMEWSQNEMDERLNLRSLSFRESEDGESLHGLQASQQSARKPKPVSRATSFSERFGNDGFAIPLPKPGGLSRNNSIDARRSAELTSSGEMSFLRRVVSSSSATGKENSKSGTDASYGCTDVSGSSRGSGTKPYESERKITIAPPLRNPFIDTADNDRKVKRSTDIYIAPFKERSRYLSDFDQEGILGEGCGAVVYRARKRLDGFCYAIKKGKMLITSESAGHLAAREACALAVLQGCPSVLRYYGCWVEDNRFWIQTELCMSVCLENFVAKPKRGSAATGADHFVMTVPLNQDDADHASHDDDDHNDRAGGRATGPSSAIGRSAKLPEPAVWRVLRVMAETLAYLHRRGIAHLDMRPANIFLRDPDGSVAGASGRHPDSLARVGDAIITGSIQPCLGDFGMSCRLDGGTFFSEGADHYLAKELLEHQAGTELDLAKCDVFSLALTVYELCKGTSLADSGDEKDPEWHYLRRGQPNEALIQSLSPPLARILRACLHPDPTCRPDAASIVREMDAQNGGANSELMVRIALLEAEVKQLRRGR